MPPLPLVPLDRRTKRRGALGAQRAGVRCETTAHRRSLERLRRTHARATPTHPRERPYPPDAETLVDALLDALERGDVRAAERDDDGSWHAVPWVKRGILLGFRVGRIVDMSRRWHTASRRFASSTSTPIRSQRFDVDRGVRIVPGGSSVRRGAYLAPGVVCMPPMYVNVGA